MSDVAQTRVQPPLDTGLACPIMPARFHSVAASPEQLAYEYAEDGRSFGQPKLLLAAKKLDLKAKSARSTGQLPRFHGETTAWMQEVGRRRKPKPRGRS